MAEFSPLVELVWDGEKIVIPAAAGTPRADQMQGSPLDQLIELSGRICYDAKTEVLTPDGWVVFPNLHRGVPVATMNRHTGKMEYQEPTHYTAFDYNGPMYCAENTKISLRVTANHDLWCLLNNKWDFRKAETVEGLRYKLRRHASFDGSIAESLVLPEYSYQQRIVNKYGEYGLATRTTSGAVIPSNKMKVWARFLGYYFSEGSVNRPGDGNGRATTIYQKAKYARPIVRCLRELGFEPNFWLDRRNGVLHIIICNSPIARYLYEFGHCASEKHLPRECLAWDQDLRRELLDALMYGDGGETESGVRIYNTRSQRLADDIQELIVKSGRVGTISYSPVANMYRIRESAHDLHTVNKHKKQDRIEHGSEPVYCVSVPNRILVVRRNRKVVLCGNCYDSLGTGRDSASYHTHIREVGHYSVHEHANLTFELRGIKPNYYLNICETLLNRVGVWVRASASQTPTAENHLDDASLVNLRVTTNFRSIREWGRQKCLINHQASDHIGKVFQNWASKLSPLACSDLAPAEVPPFPWAIVVPEDDNEVWASLYMGAASRGFSHELVRHGDWTAISQRSSRFCDESESEWQAHPLLRRHPNLMQDFDWVKRQACEVYDRIVATIQGRLTETGLDKTSARKQARGAARGILGNALETQMIFSASIAQWKWMLMMRASDPADAEIRVVFNRVYDLLSKRWPERFVGWTTAPARDGIGFAVIPPK